jgi:hypothetical protein
MLRRLGISYRLLARAMRRFTCNNHFSPQTVRLHVLCVWDGTSRYLRALGQTWRKGDAGIIAVRLGAPPRSWFNLLICLE